MILCYDRSMGQRKLLVMGIAILLLSCTFALYSGLVIAGARLNGLFSRIVSEAPVNQFQQFRCPFVVSRNETAVVGVTLANPTSNSLVYDVQIELNGFDLLSSTEKFGLTLPGEERTELTWLIRPLEIGDQAVTVQAISSQDLEEPAGLFPIYTTSFRQSCGILVINGPWTVILILLLILTGLLISWYYLWKWWRIRRRLQRDRARPVRS